MGVTPHEHAHLPFRRFFGFGFAGLAESMNLMAPSTNCRTVSRSPMVGYENFSVPIASRKSATSRHASCWRSSGGRGRFVGPAGRATADFRHRPRVRQHFGRHAQRPSQPKPLSPAIQNLPGQVRHLDHTTEHCFGLAFEVNLQS
jgi:hypothetical protein